MIQGLTPIENRLHDPRLAGARAWVTWLPYPPDLHDDEYCLIAFYSEDPHWRSLAVYNKALRFRQYAAG